MKELQLHHFWKEQTYPRKIKSTNGKTITLCFPGHYNLGRGPDFKHAKINTGGEERFGSVEIHISSKNWLDHQHEKDTEYNDVILHVFLFNGQNTNITNAIGQGFLSYQIPHQEFHDFEQKYQTKKNSSEILGACGLSLSSGQWNSLERLIFQAAEERILEKTEAIQQLIKKEDVAEEQILHRLLLRSLGFKAYADSFSLLAEKIPYSNIHFHMNSKPFREAYQNVLANWFGLLDLYDKKLPGYLNDQLRRDWKQLRQIWENSQHFPLPIEAPRLSTRPLNSPILRLFTYYQHLWQTRDKGLLYHWLKQLKETEASLEVKEPTKNLIEHFFQLFKGTQGLPGYISEKKRLLGRDRLIIIMANAIIPFFIAWSRHHKEEQMEKLLFKIFIVFPNEGENKKTHFMKQRLGIYKGHSFDKNNLAFHQGLIRIHDQYCHYFDRDCKLCSFHRLLY